MANNNSTKKASDKSSNAKKGAEAAKKDNKKIITIIAVIAAAAVIVGGILIFTGKNKKEEAKPDSNGTSVSGSGGIYHVEMKVKDYGTIKLELDGNTAPITVQNFIDLTNRGFYDGLTFHRIMSGFMIQGGDPAGNGTGGSDTTIKGEFSNNGVKNGISHTRGTISMARNPYNNNSASSQFFICHQDSVFLDGDYAAFGHVAEGMDVVDKIAADAKPTDNNGTIPASEQPVIEKVTVID